MKTAQLIVAGSAADANLLYATGIFAPDPFIYVAVAGRKYVVVIQPSGNRNLTKFPKVLEI